MTENSGARGSGLVVYGHNYCGQAVMLARVLDDYGVDYEWRDVLRGNPAWKEEVRQMARGYLSVPTVVFGDGSYLVEPWPEEVMRRLETDGS